MMKRVNGMTPTDGQPFNRLLFILIFNITLLTYILCAEYSVAKNKIQSAALLSGIKLPINTIEDQTVFYID
ncbi:unnamed protein product [Oppiella nova]|uniref:Uncharacterized protein n=1 Tax=Oppiella nova TaxID=334625 RepID=A0A7R9MLI1_9ACAR|nr:unnamed protein product [Oppiella nova]CAG2179583.1 unnamed protein product [Oppiella nova]